MVRTEMLMRGPYVLDRSRSSPGYHGERLLGRPGGAGATQGPGSGHGVMGNNRGFAYVAADS